MIFEILTASATISPDVIYWKDLGIGPVAFEIGSFPIRWYSLSYLVMIMLGYWYLTKLIKVPGSPLSQQHAEDLILYITLGVIFGGRLGYILFYKPDILANPLDIFKVWQGGMSLHGGTLGVLFALWLFQRKNGLNYLRICDYIAVCVPFGTFLVRMANFSNGELWGRATDVSWGMVFPQGGDVVRHPSQLYEAGLEGLLMAAILWPLFWRTGVRYMPGFLFGLAAMIYGFSRFIVEFFREPDAHLVWVVQETGLSMGQWLTIPMIIVGIYLVVTAKGRRERVEPIAGEDSIA